VVTRWAALGVTLACGNPSTQAPHDPPPPERARDKEPQGMKPEGSEGVVAVTWRRTIGEGEEYLEIVAEGESSLSRSLNPPDRPEIGTWRHAVPPERFKALVERLHASSWESLPANMIPGMAADVIGERRAGVPTPITHSFGRMPTELMEVGSLFAELTRDLLAHPSRVVRGEARWKSAEVAKGAEAELDVTLKNIGSQPARFSNPLAGTGWNGFRLVIRAQRPDASDKQFDLKGKDLRVEGTAPAGETFVLAPNQGITFTVRRKLAGAPGTYDARLQVYDMVPSSAQTPDLVPGVLWLPLAQLTVKP